MITVDFFDMEKNILHNHETELYWLSVDMELKMR